MGAIIDKITEFIKEMLQGWVLDNLGTMFTDVNDKVGAMAGLFPVMCCMWEHRRNAVSLWGGWYQGK